MLTTTRRVRAEEKRLIRKVILTVAGIAGLAAFALFVGLPLFAQVLLIGATSPQTNTQTDETILFSPVFDPPPEATNAATIILSGHARKTAQVILTVNNKPQDTLTVKDDGTFRSDDIRLKEGENEIAAIAAIADMESAPSKTLRIVYKKGEPNLEIAAPGEDERFSSSDKQTITIRGETDPGNRVMINERLAITDQNGAFSLNFRLSEGENNLKFVITDSAGNQLTKERKVHYSP